MKDFTGKPVNSGSGTIRIGTSVGTGAEGTVYRVKHSDSEVVKIFEKQKRNKKNGKVQAMIANKPTDPTYERSNSDTRSIVWPTAIVEDPDTEEFLGYTMPYKDLADHKNACRYARENLRWNASNPKNRYKTALNLVRVIQAIHEQGHAIGDLNHQNILINDGYVSVIDCDGFHISSAQKQSIYPDETFFPRYAPPEGRADTIKNVKLGDRFGIAVHLFQLLMEGFHPFQGQGPSAAGGRYRDMIKHNKFIYSSSLSQGVNPHSQAPDYERLPADIRDLFLRCFDAGKTESNKNNRPKMDEWSRVLTSVIGGSGTPSTRGNNTTGSGSSGQTIQSKTGSKTQTVNNNRKKEPSQTQNISPKDKKPQRRELFETVTAEVKRTMLYLGGLLLILFIGGFLLTL